MASQIAPMDMVALAREAENRDAYGEAAQLWQSVAKAVPGNAHFAIKHIAALEKSGRQDEAEVVATEANGRLLGNLAIALELGWLAARRKDWNLALTRWQEVDQKFPESPAVRIAIGTALINLGRLEEADKVFANAALANLDNFDIAIAYATLPLRSRQPAMAVERLERVTHNFPDQPKGFAELGNGLSLAGRKDEARRVLAAAAENFPSTASIAIEAAKLTEPEWSAAATKWQRVVETFPDNPLAHAGLGKALRRNGQRAAAEDLLLAAQNRFPRHFHIAFEYADLVADIPDWDESFRRWQRVVELFPDAESARDALDRARWSASYSNLLHAPVARVEMSKSWPGEGGVMARFESLGENCEFGLVQRFYGLEPLGLLRFSYVHQSSLLKLLQTGFGGVGDPEHTRLDKNDNEYLTSDRRYGMGSHTYVPPHSVHPEVFHKEQCKRLSFLRRRLLADLKAAEKIFVVTAHAPASDESALALYAALQDHGPNRLLYVRAEVPNAQPGEIRQIKDGLVFGYLDRWGGEPDGRWTISHDAWLKLCESAATIIDR